MAGDERKKRIDAILEALSDKVFVIDHNGFFVDFVAKRSENLVIPREKIVGSSIFDIFPHDEAQRHLVIFREVISDGAPQMFEYSLNVDNCERFFEAEITRLSDCEVISIVRETTQRVYAQEALKESEKRFKELAELLPEVVFETDARMVLTYGNNRAFDLFGYSLDDFEKGILCLDLVIPEERLTGRENIMKKFKGEYEVSSEYTGLRKDGTTFPMLLHSNPYFKDGKPAGIRGIIVDMTEKKKIDESISRALKLESLGFLAGGIAHDFNNLITCLFGAVDVSKNDILNGKFDEAVDVLDKTMPAFVRAKELTNQLVTFAKGGEPKKIRGDIRKTVTETVNFALTASNIAVMFNFSSEDCFCEFDPAQISQVVDNIVVNAKQAMGGKGNLTVNVEKETVGENSSKLIEPGKYVKISIKDNGPGIPGEYFQKIFDPFFTTRKDGTGLGLAISWSIIKRHNGIIDLESETGKGSTFFVYIPAVEGVLEAAAVPKKKFSGVGRILIMDDEFLIREVAGKMLKDAGFIVEKAVNGEQAVEMYKKAVSDGEPFDAIILDLTVPGGMGGHETLEKIKETDPSVVAIASSGYSEDDIISNPEKYGFAASLPKPYLRETFSDIIRKALAGRGQN